MLCDHQNQREIIHSKGGVKESVRIHKENNIFHGIFGQVGLRICKKVFIGTAGRPYTGKKRLTSQAKQHSERCLMVRWRFDRMCCQDSVDVLADVLTFKFMPYGIAYISNLLLRELAPPTSISKGGAKDKSETDPTLVRNKLT